MNRAEVASHVFVCRDLGNDASGGEPRRLLHGPRHARWRHQHVFLLFLVASLSTLVSAGAARALTIGPGSVCPASSDCLAITDSNENVVTDFRGNLAFAAMSEGSESLVSFTFGFAPLFAEHVVLTDGPPSPSGLTPESDRVDVVPLGGVETNVGFDPNRAGALTSCTLGDTCRICASRSRTAR